MSSFSFPKEEVIEPQGFVKANRPGRRADTALYVSMPRMGWALRGSITASRKTGTRWQEQVKRLIRVFRLHKSDLPQGHDILIAAKEASRLDYREVEEN
jgi:ribonuclease P protein component